MQCRYLYSSVMEDNGQIETRGACAGRNQGGQICCGHGGQGEGDAWRRSMIGARGEWSRPGHDIPRICTASKICDDDVATLCMRSGDSMAKGRKQRLGQRAFHQKGWREICESITAAARLPAPTTAISSRIRLAGELFHDAGFEPVGPRRQRLARAFSWGSSTRLDLASRVRWRKRLVVVW